MTNLENTPKCYTETLSYSVDENHYHYPEDKDVILNMCNPETMPKVYYKEEGPKGDRHKVYYYNVCASFDIETSSFRKHVPYETKKEKEEGGRKFACMYVWQFSINGKVILGRTWEQYTQLINEICKQLCLSKWLRLIVFDHNLGYEFSFIRKLFKWDTVFSSAKREPIYAVGVNGVEYRDSYILTAKSLAKVGEDLVKYPVKKLTGDLDYSLLRGPETPLTKTEEGYCINDCLVVDSLIQEKIEEEPRGIAGIPLTNTGYVRRFIRTKCYPSDIQGMPEEVAQDDSLRYEWMTSNYNRRRSFSDTIHKLTLTETQYKLLKAAFAGGFTHANALWVNKTINGIIDSFDFTSSYPAVMLSEKFPMSKGKRVKIDSQKKFEEYINIYCCVFTIKFQNIRQKIDVYENPISESKCTLVKNAVINNGRVVRADTLTTTITNVDFKVLRAFYDWDGFQVADFYRYEKGYLPKPIIEAILDLYKAKTELKGIEEAVTEYMRKKGMLNSVYGCEVTDIVRGLVEYSNDTGWDCPDEVINVADKIDKYNKGKKRFTFYPVGIFITSFARRNLFAGILEFAEDYIYSDTDSIKCINADKHMNFILWYNEQVTKKIDRCLTYYGIDPEESRPKSKDGKVKQLGIWDWETKGNPYHMFKTCGAKRYIYTQDDKKHGIKDKLHITIAGLSKNKGCEYLEKQESPFDFFSDGMSIPKEETGKLLHTYIDTPFDIETVDYMGHTFKVHEESCTHLEPVGFNMSESSEFQKYVEGVQEECMQHNRGEQVCDTTARKKLTERMLSIM